MEIERELLPGAYVINHPKYEDGRGWLSIPYECGDLIDLTDVSFEVWQTMISYSNKGVIRGLHYQVDQIVPYAINKLITCIRGSIYDVIVDLRVKSPSYGKWASVELNENDTQILFVPRGFAHGYASLTEGSQVLYYQDDEYNPDASRILAWDDPDLNINWPIDNPILSERDRTQGVSWRDYKANPDF